MTEIRIWSGVKPRRWLASAQENRYETPSWMHTFSGAEEFTYNLKNLKRATIVGETTGGGAHPGGGFRVNEHFSMFVPTGRAISPITKTNWEGTGVKPDVEVPADQALIVARLMALKKSVGTLTNPGWCSGRGCAIGERIGGVEGEEVRLWSAAARSAATRRRFSACLVGAKNRKRRRVAALLAAALQIHRVNCRYLMRWGWSAAAPSRCLRSVSYSE